MWMLWGCCKLGRLQRLPSRWYSTAIHPALLTRARHLQAEFDSLNTKLSAGFDKETATKLGSLAPIIDQYSRLNALEHELRELTELEDDPHLGNEAREERDRLIDELTQLAGELQANLVPPPPFVEKACLIEIHPGIGGSEAALFAADLLAMYENYALKNRWQTQLVSVSRTPTGGITEAILHVRERGAYARLQYEGGVHRVQRVPETETKGRVHTSTAAVVVLPDMSGSASVEDNERAFAPGELRVDVMRASGSGGQHVNTTESAVRIVHIPSGLVVTCQDERSQHKNKARALVVLRARLAQRERQEHETAERKKRAAQVTTTERSDKIRTYNYPQNRITDHRCGYTAHNLEEIMSGDRFDEAIDAMDAHAKSEAIHALTVGQ